MIKYKRNRFIRGICVFGYIKWMDVIINDILKMGGFMKL